MANEYNYSDYLERHRLTTCGAERELIARSLQCERHARLAMSVNLQADKKFLQSANQYRRYKLASCALYEITDNEIYLR